MKPQDAPTIARSWDVLQTGADRSGPGRAMALPDAAPPTPPAVRRVALISAQASPLAMSGGADGDGQHVYVTQLARQLARAGVAVDVFTRRAAPGQRRVVEWYDNVRVIHVPAGPAHHMPNQALAPHMAAFARLVERFIRRQPLTYDLVHANALLSGTAALHLKRTLGLPFALTFEAGGPLGRPPAHETDGAAAQRPGIDAAVVREAAGVITDSGQQQPGLAHLHDAVPARIAVVPRGFSSDEFWPVPMREARERLHIGARRFVVLQLGRMAPRKGVDTVIQAVAMLRQQHGVDAELIIVGGAAARPDQQRCGGEHARPASALHQAVPAYAVPAAASRPSGQAIGARDGAPFRPGAIALSRMHVDQIDVGHDGAPGAGIDGDGAELARLRQLARELGIAPHVRFEGRRPRTALRDYYAAADVFASTPWRAPLGVTAVEAMACARVVVGAAPNGIQSTVVDGVTGCLVAPRDPAALAERLAWLQRQPERARHMGQLGRVRACEHYTWQRVAQQVMALYNDILDDTRAALQPAPLSSQESA